MIENNKENTRLQYGYREYIIEILKKYSRKNNKE